MTGKDMEKKDLNYTERADGYGPAGAESEHNELPYEKKREEEKRTQDPKSPTRDEHGQPNQHGEVDQYTFRDT